MTLISTLALFAQFSQLIPIPLPNPMLMHASPIRFEDSLPRRGAFGAPVSPIDQATREKLGLKAGQGIRLGKPLSGLTAERIGLKEGDVVVSINGTPVEVSTISSMLRGIPSGTRMEIVAIQNGIEKTLFGKFLEKPRDLGNRNYSVTYSHVESLGKRMRTIITQPKQPGKHPAVFFIQGFSPISYDFTLETSNGDVTSLDGPILFDLANSGYVTIRVEKPGVGDSEGGPFAEMDYTDELDIYRQTLKQLKMQASVDVENVFIFGHSMGGAFGPMIASENKVKGLVVYGVASRTWHEYLLDTIRYQGLLAGESYEQADESVRQSSRLISLVFHEGKSIEEVKKSHPQLSTIADALMPGGYFNGKTLKFWAQLGQINFPAYWSKCGAHVLAVHGASDFVTYDVDHKLIADVVNRSNPGRGEWMVLPKSDHLFHGWATESEALKGYSKGQYNPAFSNVLRKWLAKNVGTKSG